MTAHLLEGQKGLDIEIGHSNDGVDGLCSSDYAFEEKIVFGLAYGITIGAVANLCRTVFFLRLFSQVSTGFMVVFGSISCVVGCIMICVILHANESSTVAFLYPWMLVIHLICYISTIAVFLMSLEGDISSISFVEISALMIPLANILLLWRYREYFLS